MTKYKDYKVGDKEYTVKLTYSSYFDWVQVTVYDKFLHSNKLLRGFNLIKNARMWFTRLLSREYEMTGLWDNSRTYSLDKYVYRFCQNISERESVLSKQESVLSSFKNL